MQRKIQQCESSTSLLLARVAFEADRLDGTAPCIFLKMICCSVLIHLLTFFFFFCAEGVEFLCNWHATELRLGAVEIGILYNITELLKLKYTDSDFSIRAQEVDCLRSSHLIRFLCLTRAYRHRVSTEGKNIFYVVLSLMEPQLEPPFALDEIDLLRLLTSYASRIFLSFVYISIYHS